MNLVWRELTIADAPAWCRLMAAVEDADRTGEHYSEEDARDELSDPLLRAGTAVWDGPEIVAYGSLMARETADPAHLMRAFGAVHPAYRRRGLGTSIVRWFLDQAGPIHRSHFPGRRLELLLHGIETDAGLARLAASSGFTPARWFVDMRRDLDLRIPPVSVPAGLRLVPYSHALTEAVRLARNASFADHWGSTPIGPDRWQRQVIEAASFAPAMSFALMAETVAGFLFSSYYAADTAATGVKELWINTIGTRPEWRGRGVASSLIGHALTQARAQGFKRAGLGVDADNPTGALGVYERAGFAPRERWVTYSRQMEDSD